MHRWAHMGKRGAGDLGGPSDLFKGGVQESQLEGSVLDQTLLGALECVAGSPRRQRHAESGRERTA